MMTLFDESEKWEEKLRAPFDLHVHSNFSDGADPMRDIILSAIEKGLKTLGFSDHSYIKCDEEWCMPEERLEEYKAEVNAFKKEFKGKIDILCGIEQDFHTDIPAAGYDYIIGSVHHLFIGDECVYIDESAEILNDAAEKYFGGDILSLCEAYFENVGKLYEKTGCDIVGHFDLVTKFNEEERLFDESNPRYVNAWKRAVDKLISGGCGVFEINFGAVSRGRRTTPYPSREIRAYIRERGGRFILSSDSHEKGTVAYGFSEFIAKEELPLIHWTLV